MELTHQNYHSAEANREYMSASQFKAFYRCEASALAEINGEWSKEETTALLVGRYIDGYFSGQPCLDDRMFKRDGELKSDYRYANDIIKRICADPFLLDIIKRSAKQTIRTGEIAGVPFRTMTDFEVDDMIIDLKIMRDFGHVWSDIYQSFVEWWTAWGYDYQGAIYRAIEGNDKRFGLIGATKQNPPDITAVELSYMVLDNRINDVQGLAPRYQAIKQGLIEPDRCGVCDYCRSSKKLEGFTVC